MSKRDTLRTAKRERDAFTWNTDIKTPKNCKQAKRKERQLGKTIIKRELADEIKETK